MDPLHCIEERDRRYQMIPYPIREVATCNRVISDMISRFVRGNIVTLEEFQWQTIVALSKDYERMLKAYTDYTALVSRPMIVPPMDPPPKTPCAEGDCGKYRTFAGGCTVCGAPCL